MEELNRQKVKEAYIIRTLENHDYFRGPGVETIQRGIIWYASNVLNDRWEEAEEYLLQRRNPYNLVNYARHVIKGRWPEAEERILEFEETSWIYHNHVLEEK